VDRDDADRARRLVGRVDERQRALPVVAVDDVDRAAQDRRAGGQRGLGQHREAQRVVGMIAAVAIAVQPVAVVERVALDEPHPVDRPQRDREAPVADRDHLAARRPEGDPGGGQPGPGLAVQRDHGRDPDLALTGGQGRRQGRDHVGQAAGRGPRRDLGRDREDPHDSSARWAKRWNRGPAES
jgi:hypothetical protein